MANNDIVVLNSQEIEACLRGREAEIIETVAQAYQAHARQQSSLPHSQFLRFPDSLRNRIIALPAFLGDGFNVAGVKWIASFPDNIEKGLERASAVIILNSPQTGKPEAIIEGSVISARRTAASAALAAQTLRNGHRFAQVAMIGCGLINFEIMRFLLAACPEIERFTLFDIQAERASQFRQRCQQAFPQVVMDVAESLEAALASAPLITFATTAVKPHLTDLSACDRDALLLHVSLRDLTAEALLACDNVVDDVDHVCRAETSVHLAEQLTGNRDFIRCTLADVLMGAAVPKKDGSITVFSPFGLGILDLAVARLVCDVAAAQGRGTIVKSFLPDSWNDRQTSW